MHKIAFIGAGDVVHKAYLPALSQRADCKVLAICSQHGRSAKELAGLYGIETVCEGYEELLQQDSIDTVFICTPTYLHREIAEAAIKRKKNVLVEKPLCTNYQDSQFLLQQAYRYSKTFYTAFNNQFREENQWLRSTVLTGDIGDIELIDFEWYRTKRYENKVWLYDANLSGGGVLIDLGVHMINFALSLIPDRREFTAYCNNVSHDLLFSSVEDTSVAMVTVNERITILIKVGWDMKLSMKSRVILKVAGREGCILNQDYQGHKTDGFGHMIKDFFHHIENQPNSNLELVDDTMMLIDALYQSDQSQSLITGMFRNTKSCSNRNTQILND